MICDNDMIEQKSYYGYWGKARKEGEVGHPYHLLPYHCLDVAAVGQVLLVTFPKMAKQLAQLTSMDERQFVRWMLVLLALHDLGKFTDSFQRLREDILKNLQQRESHASGGIRHDTLGYKLWEVHILPQFIELNILPDKAARGMPRKEHKLCDSWMKAATGHHGEPPSNERFYFSDFINDPDDIEAAKAYVIDVLGLFLDSERTFPDLDEDAALTASWWIAGFIVLCDWLGSSREPSEFVAEPMLLAKYWDDALQWAGGVVERSGLTSPKANPDFCLQDFFDKDVAVIPTPLQADAVARKIDSGPQLFILEDVTGAGKTEAAVLLLHKLMQNELVEGAYFALPTMATSNGMYRRMGKVYRKLYAADSTPSCTLAHSAREMSDEFRQSITIAGDHSLADYGDGTMPAAAHCSAWLADNRKKALLANVGVGTVDQVVLAVLPARHQSLRLLGLLGKCLIIDEIHSADARQNILICHLLKAHASTGGSAILLSATLPKNQRYAFAKAFASGLGYAAPTLQKTSEKDYPLLTHLGPNLFDETVLETRKSVERSVKVEFVHDETTVQQLILKASEQGQSVCWIRNTIKEARRAYKDLNGIISEDRLALFHARYAMQDRLDIESKVLDRFGPKSNAEQRKGQVLIASPVVQESLDLDFDLLISDLCPIDLIIQRAGRFRRHIRDMYGNRIKVDQDQRGEPVLFIHTPQWNDDPAEDWVKAWSKGSNAIYEPAKLWFTQKWLKENQGFHMPQSARAMIESVYGDLAPSVPEGLLGATNRVEGARSAISSIGVSDALKWDEGYRRDGNWWDEDSAATRHIEKQTTTVYLARWQNGQLDSWINEGDFRWARSAVTLLEEKLKGEAECPEIPLVQIEKIKETMPAKGRWGVLLPLLLADDGLWKGYGCNGKGERVMFFYDSIRGLMEAEEAQEP